MENIEKQVLKFTNSWADAEQSGNSSFLQETLTDDFIGIGPLGFILTKEEWLNRHKSGDLKYQSLTIDQMTIRIYNDAAILVGHQEQQGTYKGNSINAQFRIMLIFVKQNEKWKLAGLQLSQIGQPPKFGQ